MGKGYKGDTGHHHSFSENIPSVTKKYPYQKGYFGSKGQGRDYTRNISSDDPQKTAKDFYDTAANGGIESPLPNGEGKKTEMSDGTIITWRETTHSDGTPAVDINIKKSSDSGGVKYQKIHFIKE